MAHYRVANHLIQFVKGIGDSEDRLTERFGGVARFGGFIHSEDDLVHSATTIKQNRGRLWRKLGRRMPAGMRAWQARGPLHDRQPSAAARLSAALLR